MIYTSQAVIRTIIGLYVLQRDFRGRAGWVILPRGLKNVHTDDPGMVGVVFKKMLGSKIRKVLDICWKEF